MSKSSAFGFQGGAYVEVFTPQGKDPTAGWKVTGSIRKVFEKEVKSYIYVLEGVPTTTKLQLPKDSKSSITLVQRFLVLQLYLSKGQDFSVELGLTDVGKNKRRVLLSTSQRDVQTTPLHAKIPLSIVKRGIWLNLCLDLSSLIADVWKGQTFRSIENMTISANCKLRRVFTMKISPPDTTEDDALYGMNESNTGELDQIPRQCQLAADIPHLTQLFTIGKLRMLEGLKTGNESLLRPVSMLDLDLNASGRRTTLTDSNSYRIAFGSKVAVSTHRKSTKDSISSSRTSRQTSVRTDDSLPVSSISASSGLRESSEKATSLSANQMKRTSAPDQSKSDTAVLTSQAQSVSKDSGRSDVVFAQPHPPREPSKDRQRRRIRVKGHTSETVTNGVSKDFNNAVNNEDEASSSNNSKLSSDGDLEEPVNGECQMEDKGLQTPRYRERTTAQTKDSGVGPFVPEIQSPRKNIQDDNDVLEDSMSSVIRVLREQVMTSEESDTDNSAIGEYVESDDAVDNDVYMFASPPKSAPRRNISPNQEENLSSQSRKSNGKSSYLRKLNNSSSRGPCLEMDFVDTDSSDEEGDELIKQKLVTRPLSGKSSAGRHRNTPDSSNQTNSKSNSETKPKPDYVPANYGNESLSLSPRHHTSTNSMSRMNRNSLREIPKTDARLSQVSESIKMYDHTKYQLMDDLTESFEARMLASLKRQQDEEGGVALSLMDRSPRNAGLPINQNNSHNLLHVEESPTFTSDDDTSFSTWKAPAAGQLVHNYQEEMRHPNSRLSSDTLTSSNPRDWSAVFSPPILAAGESGTTHSSNSDSDPSSKISPRKENIRLSPTGQSDVNQNGPSNVTMPTNSRGVRGQEEELDLLYDPCLNCYFDPNTCKYYELI